MKDGQYYSISGWMGKYLGLRANDLICFAVIYGFSMDGESQFNGNLDYLSSCMFASRPTVLLSLKHLIEHNLILKHDDVVNGKKRCYYSTNVIYDEGYFDVQDTSKEPLSMTSKEPLPKTSKGSLPKEYNNKEDNKKENKSVSNDTQKVFPDIFDFFWENYNYKKGKEAAKRAWKRLNAEEKELAINAIEEYKRDCKRNQRQMKHPATYLNQKTWNDDFTNDGKLNNLCYDVDPDDDDKVRRFKEWMRRKHPEIEFTEKPLTFEGYMRLQDAYGMDEVCDQLDYIDANIGKYRQCDIEAIIRRYFEKQ